MKQQNPSGDKKTIHLQGIGSYPAKTAAEVKIGDIRMYNYGYPHMVTQITKQGRFLVFTVEKMNEERKTYTERKLPTTLIAVKPTK